MNNPQALILFAQVVKSGSFAKAARLLNMPTTSLSRKIQQLEDSLAGKLLQRSTRSLSLTELGKEVLPSAQLMLETMEQVTEISENMSSEPKGRLTISCSRSFAQHILCDWIAAFRVAYPLVELTLEISNRYSDLFASGLDFAFRVGPLEDSTLIAKKVYQSRFRMVASADFIHGYGPFSHPDQLMDTPCLQSQIDGRSYPWVLEKGEEKFNAKPFGAVRIDDLQVIAQLAEQGQGVAFLPELVVNKQIAEGKLQSVLPEWQAEQRSIYLVYPDRNYLPNKSRVFIDFIEQISQGVC